MFRSFFMAGFECATGHNTHSEWIDQIEATQHDLLIDEDYAMIAEAELYSAREAIRWPLVDRGASGFDFSTIEPVVAAALRRGIEPIWDLFHYGYPAGVDPFGSEFPRRFAAYCRAAAAFVQSSLPGPHYFTPINEGSYFSWAAGERGLFAPHQHGRGPELKVALARASIRGIEAILEACPEARIVNVDPICHVVPPCGASPVEQEDARHFNEHVVFEFLDMIAGTLHPELGGSRRHLDVVGLNYYWTNQWQLGREGTPLGDDDERRVPLGDLVRRAWLRYGGDVLVSETGALGDARAPWLDELAAMSCTLLEQGVALRGVCLYPVLGMPEWHMREVWTRMGLWDLEPERETLRRLPHLPVLDALRRAQHAVQQKRRALGHFD